MSNWLARGTRLFRAMAPGSVISLAVVAGAAAQPTATPVAKDIELFGQRVHYLETGTAGPAVILLHGLGVDSSQWRLTIGALASRYHVYALDQIGFGKSAKPPINYRVATLVDFLSEFYEQANIEKASLVGNSLGGWVAAAFALAHPEKVERLVLVDASGYSPRQWLGQPPTRNDLLMLNPSTLQGVRHLLGLIFHNQLLVTDQLVETAFAVRLAAGDGHVINAFIESVLREEDYLDGRLGAIAVPTLVVWGREDRMVPLSVGRALAADIPGSQLEALDNCGHVPHLECFGAFNAALQEFLESPSR